MSTCRKRRIRQL